MSIKVTAVTHTVNGMGVSIIGVYMNHTKAAAVAEGLNAVYEQMQEYYTKIQHSLSMTKNDDKKTSQMYVAQLQDLQIVSDRMLSDIAGVKVHCHLFASKDPDVFFNWETTYLSNDKIFGGDLPCSA